MFCKNCGTELPNDSKFCSNCGYSFNNSSTSSQLYYSEITSSLKNFLISIFTSPIKCCSEYSQKLSTKFSILYFIITTFIVSLICTLSLKGLIKSTCVSFIKLLNTIEGDYYLYKSELSTLTVYLDSFLDSIIPFSKTFLSFILIFVIFFGILMLISFFIHNFISKTPVKFTHYIVVASVGLTLESVSLIIFILLSFVLPTLGLLFLSVINIALIVILYSGISNLKEKKSYDPYSFAITYTIANFLTTYIIIKIALSHFLTLLITDVMSFL